MKKRNEPKIIERYNPDINIGLTDEQVSGRYKDKLSNKTKNNVSKSYFSIFASNIFTYFNLIWAVIFVALVMVGAYTDLLFILPIICNTFISIVQEIKAKRTVEKLSLVSTPRINVLRNGKKIKIYADKLVLDDVYFLEVGNVIPADSIILSGDVEVNESLLTGESKSIKKFTENELLAGSFILSGSCWCRINKIGKESYIQTVAESAKKFKSPTSNLMNDINTLVKYIGFIIIPVGALMFLNNFFAFPDDFKKVVTNTCGSLTGMVPAGMFLLITIALTVGVIKLSKKHTLVKNLYSIEMLARTNMLCLDKTGTITDGTMEVADFTMLDENQENLPKIIGCCLGYQTSNNATATAMINYFGTNQQYRKNNNISFSSERKYFATELLDLGTFAIGAPEFVCKNLSSTMLKLINQKTGAGQRVLIVAHSDKPIADDKIPDDMEPVGLLAIEDHIRHDAIDTIKWFKENNVKIKIISGDNPFTVSNIAKRVGVENASQCISLEGMSLHEVASIADKFTVFGRVSPEQKHTLIQTLKRNGYVVGMTGDGVNDTLALKEADCSIAMADGSEVARNISNLVLMDSKFSSLPAVVREGRQVVNNIQQSSALYLMKTVCTILLSIITIVTLTPYPFSPKQLLLLELFVIGLPSVILALQPNKNLIQGNFISVVLKKAIPRGFLLLFNILVVVFLGRFGILTATEVSTISTVLLVTIGYLNLFVLCLPLNMLRGCCLVLCATLILLSAFLVSDLFAITAFTLRGLLIYLGLTAVSIPVALYAEKIWRKVFAKIKRQRLDQKEN